MILTHVTIACFAHFVCRCVHAFVFSSCRSNEEKFVKVEKLFASCRLFCIVFFVHLAKEQTANDFAFFATCTHVGIIII